MKKSKIVLNILSVICFIFGALYCFTLVFIPVGVYCFAAGKLFSSKAEHVMDNFTTGKKTMVRYFVFVAIACFPLGLLTILAYNFLYGNNVKVANYNYVKINDISDEERKAKNEDSNNTDDSSSTESVEETAQIESEEEKLEKLEKLKNFKDKGIISEEEFEMAKEQMFGKNDGQ